MPEEIIVNGQEAKSYYKMTWFSIMELLDESQRFEEADYYLRHNKALIHRVTAKYEDGFFKMKVNGIRLKEQSNLGEAYTTIANAVNYTGPKLD